MLESQLQIGGEWINGAGEILESTCPVDDAVIWSGKTATRSQVDAAFAAARSAFGPWWDLSVESRIEIAEAYRDNVK
ncbi:aldehyde dehydrogenase family protein, partial [bacterium]|nr:aldehyde dehydrogenase family protein [bacterium]